MKKGLFFLAVLFLSNPVFSNGCCGYIDVEYLYWNVSQVNMPYAVHVANVSAFADFEEIRQEDHWTSGFRLSAGSEFACGLDASFSWTRFNSQFCDSFSKQMIATELLAPNLNFVLGGDGVGGPATSRWDFDFDLFDLNAGLWLCFCNALSLHPYVGLKGGTIYQKQLITYNNFVDTSSSDRVNATIEEKNNFWGIGPKIGFNSAYQLACSWWFCADFATSLLCGKQNAPALTTAMLGTAPYNSKFHTDNCRVVPFLQLFLGVEWCTNALGCYPINLGIGYETQFFWDIWRTQNSTIQQLFITDASYGSLMLHGLTAKFGLSF